jgi:hypothetical protein
MYPQLCTVHLYLTVAAMACGKLQFWPSLCHVRFQVAICWCSSRRQLLLARRPAVDDSRNSAHTGMPCALPTL